MSSASFATIPLSSRLLRTIRDVAIDNARQLLHEAPLLLRHHHHARAALLARVAIEEVGRAVQAFDALGRNVTEESVAMRVKLNFEDYSKRLNAAVFPLLLEEPQRRDEVMAQIDDLIEAGQNPRDPALYTGVDSLTGRVTTPNGSIGPAAAARRVALAKDIFARGEMLVLFTPPKLRTRAEDRAFALRPGELIAARQGVEAWEVYIENIRAGDARFDSALDEMRRRTTDGER
ncbi:AbiV family abortive infection protein [Methyloversatilis discipulorum]|uniref:AbiV family abortive infection protein n=1 Tax=Methyloversatilis discipulorum TaxID=1119528 RepID=UPI001A49B61D|nr:AbiV family abortive infection protein [Methyloversatilis discipulorum]MBL8470007.1 AbiV family abortive infection protein [Methyloversatilis discipulorum]